MKVTLVGGGSYAWTPRLVQDFLVNKDLEKKNIEFCLYDINQEHLDDIYTLCGIYKKAAPESNMVFSKTMDLPTALKDASYIIVAISQGGLEPELEDHRITRKYGFYNLKGSEVGIAGASRTLRHAPELVRIAREMEKYCPGAMLLNVTNPLSALTRSVNKYTSIKAYGFCHGIINHLHVLFPLFGAEDWKDVDFTVAGVDHCSWLLSVKHKGEDVLKLLKEKGYVEKAKRGEDIALFDDAFAGVESERLRFLIWDKIGYLPGLSDEHCVEFFGQLMKTKESREHYNITYDRIKARAGSVYDAENEIKGLIKDVNEGRKEVVLKRSGEIIDKFIASLNGSGSYIDVMNTPNIGQVPNLPMGTIVETKCLIDAGGVHPICAGNLPPILDSIVRPIALREELYMEAAIEDDTEKLKAALSMDPLVNDFDQIDTIAAELMAYNRQFWIK